MEILVMISGFLVGGYLYYKLTGNKKGGDMPPIDHEDGEVKKKGNEQVTSQSHHP